MWEGFFYVFLDTFEFFECRSLREDLLWISDLRLEDILEGLNLLGYILEWELSAEYYSMGA